MLDISGFSKYLWFFPVGLLHKYFEDKYFILAESLSLEPNPKQKTVLRVWNRGLDIKY